MWSNETKKKVKWKIIWSLLKIEINQSNLKLEWPAQKKIKEKKTYTQIKQVHTTE